MHDISVSHVQSVFVRGKAQAVWPAEGVGYHPDVPRGRFKAVDELGQLRARAEAVIIAVDGIGEPDGAIGMDDHVRGAVEGPAVVVVEEGDGLVGSFRFHVDKSAGFTEGALRAEDQAFAVVGPA